MNSNSTRLERLSIAIGAVALACSSRAAAQDALDPQPETPIRYVLEVSGGLPHYDEVLVVEEAGRVIVSHRLGNDLGTGWWASRRDRPFPLNPLRPCASIQRPTTCGIQERRAHDSGTTNGARDGRLEWHRARNRESARSRRVHGGARGA